MSATHSLNSTASFAPVLYVALELSSGHRARAICQFSPAPHFRFAVS